MTRLMRLVMYASAASTVYVFVSWGLSEGPNAPPFTWWHPALGVGLTTSALFARSVSYLWRLADRERERRERSLSKDEQELLAEYRQTSPASESR